MLGISFFVIILLGIIINNLYSNYKDVRKLYDRLVEETGVFKDHISS